MGGVLQKKKGTYIQRTPPPMEKKQTEKNKKERKRGAEYGYRTREICLDSLMVSPPTLQRHELGKSIHATFLYPTSFLPADTRYIRVRIWYWYLRTLVPGIMKLAHSTKLSTSSLTRGVVSIAKSSHSPVIGEWRGRSAHVVPSAL